MGVRVAVNTVDEGPAAAAAAGATPPASTPRVARRRRARSPRFNVVVVVTVGLIITAGLSVGANAVQNGNENRLLRQRVREVGAVVTTALPTLEIPLTSAAVLAESTNGNAAEFRSFAAPLVTKAGPFLSLSLWSRTGAPRALAVAGAQPELASEASAKVEQLFRHIGSNGTVAINNLLTTPERRVGYALTLGSPAARFVVYAELALPKDRRSNVDKNSAFGDLGYALFLGPREDTRYLIASSTGGALLQGRTGSITVPFGDAELLVVIAARKDLGGALLASLWWMLAALGLLLTLGAASLVGRLTFRRQDAELLALENARLYAEQRSVAQTLQHSLLAEALPQAGDLEFAARYIAGVEGIDIGGDWYDVVLLDSGNVLIVVGDVSGRGLEAATMMASLRFATRAYAAEGHSPSTILTKLSGLVSIGRDRHFATVLCGVLDGASGRISFSNAGHPQPLMISPAGAEFAAMPIGVPVGVTAPSPYTDIEIEFPRGATLVLYTDGAIERRGERLDVGLRRFMDVSVAARPAALDEFLGKVADGVKWDGAEDDTALLAVRWRS